MSLASFFPPRLSSWFSLQGSRVGPIPIMIPRGQEDLWGHLQRLPRQKTLATQLNSLYERHHPQRHQGTSSRGVITSSSHINSHPRRSSTPHHPRTRKFPDFSEEGEPNTVETVRGRSKGTDQDVTRVGGRARPSSLPPGRGVLGAGICPDKHDSAHIDERAPPSNKGVSGLQGHRSRRSPPPNTRKGQKPSRFQTGDAYLPSPGFGLRSAEGVGSGKAGLPQPPGFVLHVVEVLRWLGVEGVTPEVLRKAKRGLREDDVVRGRLFYMVLYDTLRYDTVRYDT